MCEELEARVNQVKKDKERKEREKNKLMEEGSGDDELDTTMEEEEIEEENIRSKR